MAKLSEDKAISYIKTEEINKSEGNVLGSMLLRAITEYFADPQHQAEFEAWREEEAQKKKGVRNG